MNLPIQVCNPGRSEGSPNQAADRQKGLAFWGQPAASPCR